MFLFIFFCFLSLISVAAAPGIKYHPLKQDKKYLCLACLATVCLFEKFLCVCVCVTDQVIIDCADLCTGEGSNVKRTPLDDPGESSCCAPAIFRNL